MIDNEYKMENELYSYFEYSNSLFPIYLTRDEIYIILCKSLLFDSF